MSKINFQQIALLHHANANHKTCGRHREVVGQVGGAFHHRLPLGHGRVGVCGVREKQRRQKNNKRRHPIETLPQTIEPRRSNLCQNIDNQHCRKCCKIARVYRAIELKNLAAALAEKERKHHSVEVLTVERENVSADVKQCVYESYEENVDAAGYFLIFCGGQSQGEKQVWHRRKNGRVRHGRGQVERPAQAVHIFSHWAANHIRYKLRREKNGAENVENKSAFQSVLHRNQWQKSLRKCLNIVQFLVLAAQSHQFGVGAALNNLAVLQNANQVGVHNRREPVGDDD